MVARRAGATLGHVAAVVALSIDDAHQFSKRRVDDVTMIAGVGIEGDTHAGPLVQHRSRVRVNPNQPNLRQVHLIDESLFAMVGGVVGPGDLGENVTTSGVDLYALTVGTVLALGRDALVAVTGLRNPCAQIERFRPGLLDQVRWRDADGELVRRAGVMGVVVRGGRVAVGDEVAWSVPPGTSHALQPV